MEYEHRSLLNFRDYMQNYIKYVIPLFPFTIGKAFAQTHNTISTEIICVSKTGNWKKLENNGINYVAQGQFFSRLKKLSSGHLFSYRYFQMVNTSSSFQELKSLCKKYGDEYVFVQANSNRIDEWCLLGDMQYIYEGIYTLRNISVKSKIPASVQISSDIINIK